MTRDEIIRMAREAGFEINKGQYHGMDADSYLYIWCDGGYLDEELERFAALVSAAEREPFTEDELMPIRRRMMMEAYNAADDGDSERYNALKVMANDVLDMLLGVKK